MNHINIDIETYSSVDIRKSGLFAYADSPDFTVLLFAYSINGASVQLLDLTAPPTPEQVAGLRAFLLDPANCLHAYNATFEWYCLSKWLQLTTQERATWLTQWRCTMVQGLYCGYPAGLQAVGSALGLPQEKQKLTTGKALIKLFCAPTKPTAANGHRTRTLPHHEPEKWQLFCDYCKQDVVTEMAVADAFALHPVPDFVQEQWVQDAKINARGVAIDHKLLAGALYCDAVASVPLLARAKALTGLENPKSTSQLLPWLNERGAYLENLRKDTLEIALEGRLPDEVREVLLLRQSLSRTSTKKYTAMVNAMGVDGRIRGLLQFYGANRTGRWAGRLVQAQNLPRTYLHGGMLDLAREITSDQDPETLAMIYGDVSDTLSQLVRTTFVPKDGHRFVDADFSAIEARVIAWLAGEAWVLQVFRTHGKIYEATASQMFGVPIDRIVKGNPEYDLRQKGKVATLALGFQGGTGALIKMNAVRNGIPEEDLPDIVSRWRSANPAIVALWRAVEQAALQAVETGLPVSTHGLTFARECVPQKGLDWLTILLPSGRKLYYAQPHFSLNPWGKNQLNYYHNNQTTGKWCTTNTYGGKLTENIVQAIARDCLAHSINLLEQAGFPIVFHIHDEVVIEMPTDKADLSAVTQVMRQTPPWATGLPLDADGWVGEYFTKD